MRHWSSALLVLRVALSGTAISLILGLWFARLLNLRGALLARAGVSAALALPPAIFCAYFLFRFTGRPFHWPWAAVSAVVNGLPLLLWWALSCLERLDRRYENAARSLGASEWRVFWRIAFPLAWQPILAGAAIVFVRISVEFAAVLLIARRLHS